MHTYIVVLLGNFNSFMKKLLAFFITFSVFVANIALAREVNHITLHNTGAKEDKKFKTNDLFKSYLELSAFRHKVLSQNLANVNTPGYKADEVTMPTKYEELRGKGKVRRKIRMVRTSNKHMIGAKDSNGKFESHKLQDPYEIKKNGNNVSLAQQMTKLSQNKNDYAAAAKAYATTNSLFSSVLGR